MQLLVSQSAFKFTPSISSEFAILRLSRAQWRWNATCMTVVTIYPPGRCSEKPVKIFAPACPRNATCATPQTTATACQSGTFWLLHSLIHEAQCIAWKWSQRRLFTMLRSLLTRISCLLHESKLSSYIVVFDAPSLVICYVLKTSPPCNNCSPQSSLYRELL